VARYQMLWDCASCGTTQLLGLTHRHCPNCGAVQDAKRRYFPAEGEEVAVEGHTYVGVDRECPACQTPNSAASGFCVNCGSPLDGAAAVPLRNDDSRVPLSSVPDPPVADPPVAETLALRPSAPEARLFSAIAVEDEAPPRRKKWPMAVAGLVMSALVALFWTRDITATATAHAWVRAIDVEQLTPTAESDWRDRVPSGAYGMSCSREVRSHQQIADGETCSPVRRDQGDGTFTTEQSCTTNYRSEPVYDDKCSYTIDRWKVIRTAEAKGRFLTDEPRWPRVTLSRPGACVGCDREGQRREDYSVTFSYEGESTRCSFPEARWRAIPLGKDFKAKALVVTGLLTCSSIE
jgi:hypothetical protein